ncbi:MAG: hypothetical protein WC472_01685 [Candidatus Paceibacterota bacterium]
MERQLKVEYIVYAILPKEGLSDEFGVFMSFETEKGARNIYEYENMKKKKICKIKVTILEDCKEPKAD